MSNVQSRGWVITLNNPNVNDDQLKAILETDKRILFAIFQLEQGKEKHTPHYQMYIRYKHGVRFNTVKDQFDKLCEKACHIEKQKGNNRQAWEYCKKSETKIGKSIEIGKLQGQGARNDIARCVELIEDGATDLEILREYPDTFVRYADKFGRVRQEIREEKYRKEWRNLSVTYICGPTGCGKTRTVMDTEGYENVYRVTNYKNPFDGYKGQEVVLFEEFRGQLKISDMLNYLDGYPLVLPSRYFDRIACFTKVYIISNEKLDTLYPQVRNDHPETFKALKRRITEVVDFYGDLPF